MSFLLRYFVTTVKVGRFNRVFLSSRIGSFLSIFQSIGSDNGSRNFTSMVYQPHTHQYQVLEYLREKSHHTTNLLPNKSTADGTGSYVESVDGNSIHQQIFVLAHSLNPKPSELLRLFAGYVKTKRVISHDLLCNHEAFHKIRLKVPPILAQMSFDELETLAGYLRILKPTCSSYYGAIISDMIFECQRRMTEITQSSTDVAIRVFHVAAMLCDQGLENKLFHSLAHYFNKQITRGLTVTSELINIIYFFGFGKPTIFLRDSSEQAAKTLTLHFSDMSFIEQGIAISGIYRSNPPISHLGELVELVARSLHEQLMRETLNEMEIYGIMYMVKLLRIANYYNKSLFDDMRDFLLRAEDNFFSSQILTHLLMFFANVRVYDADLFSRMESLMVYHINQDADTLRLKDIAKCLWCFCHIGHPVGEDMVKASEEELRRCLLRGDLRNYPHLLADVLLQLAILERYPKDLIEAALELLNTKALQKPDTTKRLSRLVNLYEVINVVKPEWNLKLPDLHILDLPRRNISDELKFRPGLTKLSIALDLINREVGGNHVLSLGFPVAHINHACVILDTRVKLSGQSQLCHQLKEVIDNTTGVVSMAVILLDMNTGLRHENRPLGLVTLQIRVLERRGWKVVTMTEKELNCCGDEPSNVASMLLNKLKC